MGSSYEVRLSLEEAITNVKDQIIGLEAQLECEKLVCEHAKIRYEKLIGGPNSTEKACWHHIAMGRDNWIRACTREIAALRLVLANLEQLINITKPLDIRPPYQDKVKEQYMQYQEKLLRSRLYEKSKLYENKIQPNPVVWPSIEHIFLPIKKSTPEKKE